MSICTCSGKNLTIPVEGLTESSLFGWTIYGFALWIGWAYLSQVQGYNAIATTCEWEVLLVITCYIIRYAIPYIRCIAELSAELSLYILALWNNRDTFFCHIQCNDTIATIRFAECYFVFSSLRDGQAIPLYWFTEVSINGGICILALVNIWVVAYFGKNQSDDTIASIYSLKCLGICTCSSQDLTIPVEGITENSLCCVTIYSYTWFFWIRSFTNLSQDESDNAIATISSGVLLIVCTFGAICDTIPCISLVAELSCSSRTIDSLTFWIIRIDNLQCNHLEVHCSLLWSNNVCELVERHRVRLVTKSEYLGRSWRYRSIVLAICIDFRNQSSLFLCLQIIVYTQANVSTCCVETSNVKFIELVNNQI